MANMPEQLANVAQGGDRLATLEALRDRLAREIDDCAYTRDLPALMLRFTDVLAQIAWFPEPSSASARLPLTATATLGALPVPVLASDTASPSP